MLNKIIKYIQLLYICGTSFCASELLYLLIITCTVHMIQKYLRYMYVVAVYTNVHDICVTCTCMYIFNILYVATYYIYMCVLHAHVCMYVYMWYICVATVCILYMYYFVN